MMSQAGGDGGAWESDTYLSKGGCSYMILHRHFRVGVPAPVAKSPFLQEKPDICIFIIMF